MPLYEFKCQVCGFVFEDLVRTTVDVGEVKCPTCGAQAADRLLSAAALGGSGGEVSAGGGGGGGCGGGHGGFT